MQYESVAIYTLGGDFVGYSILKGLGTINKLQSVNIWSEEEMPKLTEQLGRLNGDVALRAHWPRQDDPEVLALLNDPNFMPLETEVVDVVDDGNSYYAYTQVLEVDALGKQTGRIIDGDLDREASVLAYKKAVVPVRPIDAQIRTKKAHEIVAQRRAGL